MSDLTTPRPDAAPFSDGSGFTPGPWAFEGRSAITAPDAVVAHVIRESGADREGAANARLIAAAPELFAAAACLPIRWLKQGILQNPSSDELRIEVRIVGTTYKAELTVAELRAAAQALTKAGASS